VLKVVSESDADAFDLDDNVVRDTRIIWDARGMTPRVIAIPATDKSRCDPVEAIHYVDGVEVAAMEDAVAPRQRVIGLRGKICTRRRNVRVTNQADADCHRLKLSRHSRTEQEVAQRLISPHSLGAHYMEKRPFNSTRWQRPLK
jgi:hypothetical protein